RRAPPGGAGAGARLFRRNARDCRGVGAGRIRFGPEAPPPRRQQTGPGGDDQAALRARERGTGCWDDAPIGFAVLVEPREVVVEGGVIPAVRASRSALQAVEICKRAAVDLGGSRGA